MKLEEYPHEDKMEGTGVQFWCKRGLIKTYNKLFLAAIFFLIARVKFACAIKTTLLMLFSNSRKLSFFWWSYVFSVHLRDVRPEFLNFIIYHLCQCYPFQFLCFSILLLSTFLCFSCFEGNLTIHNLVKFIFFYPYNRNSTHFPDNTICNNFRLIPKCNAKM